MMNSNNKRKKNNQEEKSNYRDPQTSYLLSVLIDHRQYSVFGGAAGANGRLALGGVGLSGPDDVGAVSALEAVFVPQLGHGLQRSLLDQLATRCCTARTTHNTTPHRQLVEW
jgi:hypothetical protein